MGSKATIKTYLLEEKIQKADIGIAAAMVLLAVFCFFFRMPLREAFQSKEEITLGYSAKAVSEDTLYVLDDSHTRILCFDREGKIRFTLENLSDEQGNLPYIDDFAVTEKGIYVCASEWDGMTLAREAILLLDPEGRYLETVENRDYSANRTNKHRLYGISEYRGTVQYLECLEDSILMGEQEIPYANAFNAVSDALFVGGTAYVLDKDGSIYALFPGKQQKEPVFTLPAGEAGKTVPYRLAADPEGTLYFTDIRNETVCRLDMAQGTAAPLLDSLGALTVSISPRGEFLLLDDGGLHLLKEGQEEKVYLALNKPLGTRCFQAGWLFAAAALLFLGLLFLVRLVRVLSKTSFSPPTVFGFFVFGTVLVVAVILCSLLMNAFAQNYREKIIEQLECSAYMVANQIQPEDLEEIEETGGFGGTSYTRLCRIMENSFSADIPFYNQIYCNILTLDSDRETGHAVAYLDQSIGSYFPLDEVETRELQEVYKTGETVRNDSVEDISGNYLTVKVPVFNQADQVCGAVAVGVDNYVVENTLQQLIQKIWLSIAIILMLVWLVSMEIFSFASNYWAYKNAQKNAPEKTVFPAHKSRLVIFLVFTAYNMTAAFLPVYLLRQSEGLFGGMREVAGALPITINIFLIGFMSLFCAQLVRKFGLRAIMRGAAACSLLGNGLIYSLPGFYPALLGLVLDGIGVGLITNAVYIMVTYIKDKDDRAWGLRTYNSAYLSGINFGMMLGSVLAVNVGQRMVFGVVALVWVLLAIFTGYMVQYTAPIQPSPQECGTDGRRKMSFKTFLWNRSVLGFMVLVQNPCIIFGSFVFYYVPIFCDMTGYNETICSILIMLYSQVAVIGTDTLTGLVLKRCKNHGFYLSTAINIGALLVFALRPGLGTMITALILMGTSAAFGKPVQQDYFLNLKNTQEYGEDRAMGIYNFTENIGESAGPMVFGRLLSAPSFGAAASLLCGGIGVLSLLHYGMTKIDQHKTPSRL